MCQANFSFPTLIKSIAQRRKNIYTFVTDDKDKITALRRNLATGHIEYFLKKMEELGYSRDAALDALKKYTENEGRGENDVQ